MSENNGGYKKVLMGTTLETGWFSSEGSSGLNLSSYDGYLKMSFWVKGEKSSENRDRSILINADQARVINKTLIAITLKRMGEYAAGQEYSQIDSGVLNLNITGFQDGKVVVYGVINFDTVNIDGINRVRINLKRGETVSSVTFYSEALKSMLPVTGAIKLPDDILEQPWIRFCTDMDQWLNSRWMLGGFNKLYQTSRGGNTGGGYTNNNNNGGGYNRGGSSNGGNNPRYDTSSDHKSPMFDDGGEF